MRRGFRWWMAQPPRSGEDGGEDDLGLVEEAQPPRSGEDQSHTGTVE